MARSTPTSKKKTTVTRTTRGGVSGTLVRTTSSRSRGSAPRKTYAQLAKEGGNVAAAKAYNTKKTSESFRPDAPKKLTPKKASISTPKSTPKLAGKKLKTSPIPSTTPKRKLITITTSSKNKGKLKKKINRTRVKMTGKAMAAKTKRVSRRGSKCGAKGCAPSRKYKR